MHQISTVVMLTTLLLVACKPTRPQRQQAQSQAVDPPTLAATDRVVQPLPSASGDQVRFSLAPLVEQVRPSVVGVTTHRRVSQPSEDMNDLFRHFFGDSGPGPQRPRVETGLGSGFVIDQRGLVLTNYHVVAGADEVLVRTADDREWNAKVVGSDQATDVALIRLKEKPTNLSVAALGDSDALRVGDFVVAIGNPFGLELTVTSGIISAKARIIGAGPYDDFLQTDAAINPGNSGGPLFDLSGRVVGINTAIVSTGQGIGFAVPMNLVKALLGQLEKNGKVVRGYLGVSLQDITPDLSKALGTSEKSGALVGSVEPNGPAAKAGLLPGDIVTTVNGEPVKSAAELARRVAVLAPGQKVTLGYVRQGKSASVEVVLGKRPEKKRSRRTPESQEQNLGLALQDIPPQARAELGTDEGALVTEVESGSRAARSGLRPGDVIVQANHQPVRSPDDFVAIIRSDPQKQIVVRVLRAGSGLYLVIPTAK